MGPENPNRSEGRSWALRGLAAAYLLVMWLEGPGWVGPLKHLPSVVLFFAQCTALFPRAARASIEYRAEGYVCAKGEWEEVDTRPYFRIDADDKESRFQRAMFFYRHNKKTMGALDRYLVRAHNRRTSDDGEARDETIGGVRLFSIRTPLPEIGDPPVRVRRRALADIPREWRKVFYETRSATTTTRCFGTHPKAPPAVEPEESPKDEPPREESSKDESP